MSHKPQYQAFPEAPYVRMASGRRVYVTAPRREDINFVEIAHHLAQINRFAGGTRFPYSVAQHSVLVHDMLPPEVQLYGLLHDAHEAYTGDIITPIKAAIGWICPAAVDAIHEIQDRLDEAILEAANLAKPNHSIEFAVKEADNRAFVTEAQALRTGFRAEDTSQPAKPFDVPIVPMLWWEARDLFIERLDGHLGVFDGS